MSVCHMHAWYTRRPEEGLDALELEVQAVVNCHVSVGKLSQDPLGDQTVLLIAEPPL